MRDYSSIAEVKVSESVEEVNHLLSEGWEILDTGFRMFVLGRDYSVQKFREFTHSLEEAKQHG